MRIPSVCAHLVMSVALLGWTGLADAQANDGQVIVVAKFYPTPGREDEVQARFLKLVQHVRKAEPKTVYRLHRSNKEPTAFLFYEVYESKAAQEHHREVLAAFRKDYGPPPDGMFARPAEVESYQDIAN
jgi:quinol monooxygenase YgiN